MRYVTQLLIGATNVVFGAQVFAANNPYDPYVGVGDHSAMGYGQWAPFYNNYVVVGSRCSATFAPISQDNGDMSSILGVFIDRVALPNSGSLADITNLQMNPVNKYRIMTNLPVRPVTISSNYSAKKMFSISKVRDNQNLWGNFSTSTGPVTLAYYNVYVCPLVGGGSDPPEFTVNVVVDYLVLLLENLPLPTSS